MKTNLTIGIPTFEAGDSLIRLLKQLKSFHGAENFLILLVIDGSKIERDRIDHISKLLPPGSKIIRNAARRGQAYSINKIFKSANTELLLLLNDDVILDTMALPTLRLHYKNTKADLITTKVVPVPGTDLFAKSLSTGTEISYLTSLHWNKGINYLMCNGRMIMLAKTLYSSLAIPITLWNNDAFIYFYALHHGFKISRCDQAIVYYRLPASMAEHLNQSHKFQKSKSENERQHFTRLHEEYKIPLGVLINAVLHVFSANPFTTIGYLTIALITRISVISYRINPHKKGYWITDKSTKSALATTL